MIPTPRRPLSAQALRVATAVILIAVAGCDNVEWGGIQMSLQAPPSATGGEEGDALPVSPDSLPSLPSGPVMYAGWRNEDGGVSVTPVAELRRDSLVPLHTGENPSAFRELFVRELIPTGTELTLFSAGTRVGTLLIEGGEGADSLRCGARPLVAGTPELIAGAEDAERFLALPKGAAGGFVREAYRPIEPDAGVRRASVNRLAEVLAQLGASWPSSTVQARQDLQAFRLDDEPAFSATFVYRDELAVGDAPGSAYSLLLLGSMDGLEYNTAYVWYREVSREGKGAPRFWQELDWDGDGETEILMEIFGAQDRWWSALGRDGSGWTRVYSDPCGGSPVPDDGGTAGGSAGG